ncbi:MAG TPA: HlyD family efflux transporter periplasmic adaptor subunit [Candidatus Paceibacterota bacterium]|nr:HlyD family efflux transporter periplasmic adaptor subunit [Candidatus Paceibacterota bacterium]
MNQNEEIKKELKKDEEEIRKLKLSVRALTVLVCLVLAAAIGILAYWKDVSGKVFIDKSEISAPEIDLAPESSDYLEEMFVKKGDTVKANEPVARVGNELVKAKTDGVIIAADATIGQLYNHGQTIVKMIDPNELRVVGHLDENKGLSEIRVGDYATFTVDAFGSKQYEGVVDEVSPTSRQSDVVFSISDKREVRVFDVKVRYDLSRYPELRNGMSARLSVYTR